MGDGSIRSLRGGVKQSGVRDYNERLLLTILQRNGAMPGSDLARVAGLSPQTVSVILRKLENDGLLSRGLPTKGRVGKPSVPMELAGNGVFSIGLKIGRRSVDLLLMDFQGVIRKQLRETYSYPLPAQIFEFLKTGLNEIERSLTASQRQRICGIGIAAPFEIWNWNELIGAPASEFQSWKDVDFVEEVGRLTDLPVAVINDATAACQAEQVFGRGKEFCDYAYFYVAAFIGGGIVLNHSVYEGLQKNAGALGSLPSSGKDGKSTQLIDTASIHLLESRLEQDGLDRAAIWSQPQDWSGFEAQVAPWLDQTASEIAKACLSACSIIDFEAIFIDGAFPSEIRERLVEKVRQAMTALDSRGLIKPRIEQGTIGQNARSIGAACRPVFSKFLLNTNAGFSA